MIDCGVHSISKLFYNYIHEHSVAEDKTQSFGIEINGDDKRITLIPNTSK